MLFLNPAYLATFFFKLRISALFINGQTISIPFPVQAKSILELQVRDCFLNIGQNRLNVALTM